jgi:imidazolonepropionase
MSGSLLLESAAQVVVAARFVRGGSGLHAEVDFRPNASVLIEDGRVVRIGASHELRRDHPAVPSYDCTGKVVTPGLVDAHTHLVFAGSRLDEFEQRCRGVSYAEIAQGGGGILATVRATRAASDQELVEGVLRRSHRLLACGTTCAETKSGYGLSTEHELRLLRVIREAGSRTPLRLIPTFLGAHAVPPEAKGDADGYVHQVVNNMLPTVAKEGLASYCDVFCEQGYFDTQQTRRILAAAKALGLGLRLHADQLSNSGGALLAAELGAVTADHLEETGPDGIRALAQAGVQPVLLPASVFGLGRAKYPDARSMLRAGLSVVLASDFNPGSSPTPSLPMVMAIATRYMNMTAAECLAACTSSAARSIGLEGELGGLEVGMRADVAVWDCEDWRELCFQFGDWRASAVFVGGRPVPIA